jgi:hypothetical protein
LNYDNNGLICIQVLNLNLAKISIDWCFSMSFARPPGPRFAGV